MQYTTEIANRICERIADGEFLRVICRDEGMPPWRTVYNWINAHPEFAERMELARAIGADAIASDCLEIADTPLLGEEVTIKGDGTEEVKRSDMLGHRKLQIETRLKMLAKWHPKKYGEKVAIGGDPENPIMTEQTLDVSKLPTDVLAAIMSAKDAAAKQG